MAVGAGIKQSISLTGDTEVKRQFAAISAAGKQALSGIESASGSQSGIFDRLSGFISRIGTAFTTAGAAVGPLREGISSVSERSEKLGKSIERVADNALPHWRTVLELTIAAGVAGFSELVISAAKTADNIGDQSTAMGITVDRYQQFSLAAKMAGIDAEKFGTIFERLTQKLEEESAAQLDTLVKLAEGMGGTLDGVTQIMRGMGDAADDLSGRMTVGFQDTKDRVLQLQREEQRLQRTQRDMQLDFARRTRASTDEQDALQKKIRDTQKIISRGSRDGVFDSASIKKSQRSLDSVQDQIDAIHDRLKAASSSGASSLDVLTGKLNKVQDKIQDLQHPELRRGGGKLLQVGPISKDFNEEIAKVADLLQGTFKQAGITRSIQDITASLETMANQSGDAGVKWRGMLREFGAKIPAKTVTEALDIMKKDFSQKLGDFVPLWERTVDGIKKRRLDQVFLDFADKMAAIEDPGKRAATIIQIFGARSAKLAPMLAAGRKGITDLAEVWTKAGIAFKQSDIDIGGKLADSIDILETALSNTKNLIGLAFAPVAQPLVDVLTDKIVSNAHAIREWAATVAESFRPAVEDLIALLNGASKQDLQTQTVRDAVTIFNGLKIVVEGLGAAFDLLGRVIEFALSPLQKWLGTDVSGKAIIITALVLKLVGVFGILRNVTGLLWAAFARLLIPLAALIVATIGWPATIALLGAAFVGFLLGITDVQEVLTSFGDLLKSIIGAGMADLDSALNTTGSTLSGAFTSAWNLAATAMQNAWNWASKLATDIAGWILTSWATLSSFLSTAVLAAWQWIQTAIQGVWNWLSKLATDVMGWVTDAFTGLVSTLTGAVVGAWNAVIDTLKSAVNWFRKVANAASNAVGAGTGSANASLLQGEADAQGGDVQPAGFARGGGVPGSGRGDKVRALLEPGEFVTRLHAVKTIGADVFAAMNAFPERFRNLRGALSGSVRRFALGGLVDGLSQSFIPQLRLASGGMVPPAAADGSRSNLTLVLDGRGFPLTGRSSVVEELGRHARTKKLLSAGRAPSFVG
jgi:hypothetical protein